MKEAAPRRDSGQPSGEQSPKREPVNSREGGTPTRVFL